MTQTLTQEGGGTGARCPGTLRSRRHGARRRARNPTPPPPCHLRKSLNPAKPQAPPPGGKHADTTTAWFPKFIKNQRIEKLYIKICQFSLPHGRPHTKQSRDTRLLRTPPARTAVGAGPIHSGRRGAGARDSSSETTPTDPPPAARSPGAGARSVLLTCEVSTGLRVVFVNTSSSTGSQFKRL